ncbi:MAG TPA: hypothetical protein VIW29_21855 [Polyangiaceae bacterium]
MSALPACGSGPGSATDVDVDDSAPVNEDRPPRNGDSPPYNADAPPASADDAPGTDDGSAPSNGGQLVALCQQLCGRLSACEGGMGSLCESNCNFSNELSAALSQCENEVVDVWSCALRLPSLCDSEGSGAIDIDDTQCGPASERAEDCFDELDLDVDVDSSGNGNGGGNPPPPNPCSPAGGCQCATTCLTCQCAGATAVDCGPVCM